jgi:two-component sensor histidine kinase/predicted hydrocarbon binding protein
MKPNESNEEFFEMKKKIELLEKENRLLREQMDLVSIKHTVIVPDQFKPIFDQAERNVRKYFSDVYNSAENGEIDISGERYILIRSAALSYEFLDIIKELYSNNGEQEAIRIGNNFLFDIGHVLGKKDAKAFHEKMHLTDPIEKLSAGPVHFAFTGWANVEILAESNPSPDDNFFLSYYHHNSFEAQSWKKAGRFSERPVCIMNSGYSSGWCEESFGIPLTTVEVTCEAHGDEFCSFIMAPPHRINEYIKEYSDDDSNEKYEVPIFFQRKVVEDKLRDSLHQKETLLKEVHHRVKNNLQIISSLFRLQLNNIENEQLRDVFLTSLNRVNTMSMIHELIYGDKDLSGINIKDYCEQLMSSLSQLYRGNISNIKLEYSFDLKHTTMDPDRAIPLGLILNEIASNAFKYGLTDEGVLKLSLHDDDNFFYLTFSDNGPGLPKAEKQNTLGMSLISILCEQIDADLKIDSSNKGLSYSIVFKK